VALEKFGASMVKVSNKISNEFTLAKNTLYAAMSSASNGLLIVLVIIAARILGDTNFGYFSFALAVASVFEIVTDFGLNTFIVRSISRNRNLTHRYLPHILGWKLVLSALAITLLVLFTVFTHQPLEARVTTYILGGAIVLRSYKNTLCSLFQAYERFDLVLLTTYIERLLIFISCTIVLFATRSLIGLVLAFALIRVPDLLFGYYLLNKKVTSLRMGFDLKYAAGLHRTAVSIGVYGALLMIYSYVGTLILALFRSAAEVGWYNAGYKIYEGLTMVPYLLGAALLPRLSHLFEVDRNSHACLSGKVLNYLVVFSIPLVVSVAILAPSLVLIIYGKEYVPAIPVLKILAVASSLMFLNWTLSTILISANRENLVVRVMVGGVIVMMFTNIVLVSRLGIIGAGYSVLASELFVFGLLSVVTNKVLFRLPICAFTWRPAVASGIGGAIIYFFSYTPVFSVLTFFLLYSLSLLVLALFDANKRSVIVRLVTFRSLPPN
jgi:O-antigen/teichoic acid export membrane protein